MVLQDRCNVRNNSGSRERTETLRCSCCTQATQPRSVREQFGARRKTAGVWKGGRRYLGVGLQTCLFIFLGSSWLTPQPTEGLAAPPHLRACPGPLDDGNAFLCGIPGNVTFAKAIQEVRLSAGQAFISVSRVGGFLGSGVVSYETVNNTARAGIEFVATEGALSWSPNDGQDRLIPILLINSGQYKTGRYLTSFNIRIFEPIGIGLGSIVETEVRIVNTNAVTGRLNLPTSVILVNEQSGTVSANVTRIGGTDCTSTVQYRTVAIPGSDYGHYGLNTASQRGALIWNEGDSSQKRITIPIRDNSQLQSPPGEEFFIELYDSSCARIGNGRVRVIVTDDEQVGVLRVVTPRVSVRSDGGFATVKLSRVNGAATPVSVAFFTSAGTAVEGTDFTATSGTLIWQHAESGEKTISIPVLDNIGSGLLEKSLTLRLAYLTGIELEVADYTVDVTIVNTFADAGQVGFTDLLACQGPNAPTGANCHYVFERERNTTIEVVRTGNTQAAVAVTYTVVNITAESADDYIPLTGRLSWGVGDASSRFITVQIRSDAASLPIVEFLKVTLADADPLVRVVDANASTLYVGVLDDDGGGVISIEADRVLVNESDGVATFTIRRRGAAVGSASATWQTVDGDAVAGIDYVKAADTVSWADGVRTSQPIEVQLIQDGASRLGLQFKHFFVSLTAVTLSTFADPRAQTAAVFVADDGARTGFLLFPQLEFDPFTRQLSPAVAHYRVDETAGQVELVVMRKDGFEGN
eukprot:529148-Rhodomonas_salina.1